MSTAFYLTLPNIKSGGLSWVYLAKLVVDSKSTKQKVFDENIEFNRALTDLFTFAASYHIFRNTWQQSSLLMVQHIND